MDYIGFSIMRWRTHCSARRSAYDLFDIEILDFLFIARVACT